jgi:uncharacterized membrane protein HdeD (DUF308 family)
MTDEMIEAMSKAWGWMLAMGIVMVILGTLGLGATFMVTMATMFFFGVLILIGSGAQLVEAFYVQGWKSRVWHVLVAVLYFVAGITIINQPALASTMFTLIIAFTLIAIGGVRIIAAFQMRGVEGWVWMLIAGIAAVVLGTMIVAKWPVSGLWVIGLYVAIELIMNGWSMIAVALAAKKMKSLAAAPSA